MKTDLIGQKFSRLLVLEKIGVKKSAKGLICVNNDLTLTEQVSPEKEQTGLLQTVFLNGKLIRNHTLNEVRNRLLRSK